MTAEQIHDQGACKRVDDGITRVFQLLGKRWNGPILSVLMERPTYFSELRRAIPGLSERMLADRLVELGAAGLVLREVDEGPPLRVSYRLTTAGTALEPALRELAAWARGHLPDVAPCVSEDH
ncbi:winged helix-turn-helix transcriptional regulator [Streptomyces sp. NPDC005374]|uniref:winged helix-turn-helix transcriptional regulator n=1 Tax=Streptomyces sp. NPDC005374 TaxID=3364713 RepID=UPI0036AECE10